MEFFALSMNSIQAITDYVAQHNENPKPFILDSAPYRVVRAKTLMRVQTEGLLQQHLAAGASTTQDLQNAGAPI